jgi:hypothetical protein
LLQLIGGKDAWGGSVPRGTQACRRHEHNRRSFPVMRRRSSVLMRPFVEQILSPVSISSDKCSGKRHRNLQKNYRLLQNFFIIEDIGEK